MPCARAQVDRVSWACAAAARRRRPMRCRRLQPVHRVEVNAYAGGLKSVSGFADFSISISRKRDARKWLRGYGGAGAVKKCRTPKNSRLGLKSAAAFFREVSDEFRYHLCLRSCSRHTGNRRRNAGPIPRKIQAKDFATRLAGVWRHV